MIDHQLRVLASGIAEHLDGFRVVFDDELGHAAWLEHPDGRRLFLRRQRVHGGRVEISGAFPDSDYPFEPGERPRPITVAAGRSPAAVASEITRRLLPGYAQALARVRERIARQVVDHQSRVRVAERLAAIIPGASVRDDGRHVTTVQWSAPARSIGSGNIQLRRAGALATLRVHSLPIATMERLAEVLASLAMTTPGCTQPPDRAARRTGGAVTVRVRRLAGWSMAMTRWQDETGTFHLMAVGEDGLVGPVCGSRAFCFSNAAHQQPPYGHTCRICAMVEQSLRPAPP